MIWAKESTTLPIPTSDMAQAIGHAPQLWNPNGQHIPIGGLGAWWSNGGSYAWAINDAGQVVGSRLPPCGPAHAFLYSGGSTFDLNILVPPNLGWTLISARNIDDAGRILALGAKDGVLESHAFLLTPMAVPEPTPLALLLLGGAVLWARRRARSQRRVA